jgi:hypothetical protein
MHRLRGSPRRLTVEETRAVLTKRDAAARLEGLAATTNLSLFQARALAATDRPQSTGLSIINWNCLVSCALSG